MCIWSTMSRVYYAVAQYVHEEMVWYMQQFTWGHHPVTFYSLITDQPSVSWWILWRAGAGDQEASCSICPCCGQG